MASLADFKYEVDGNIICLIRLLDDPILQEAYGAEPTVETDQTVHQFHAINSLNKNQWGIHPRGVIWKAKVEVPSTDATAPIRYFTSRLFLPILTGIVWTNFDATKTSTETFNWQGLTYTPAKKIEERRI